MDLNDFDVMSQLAQAGGRTADDRPRRPVAFSSRSGLTRVVDRLVEEGLVGRTTADDDARGVVVTLTRGRSGARDGDGPGPPTPRSPSSSWRSWTTNELEVTRWCAAVKK